MGGKEHSIGSILLKDKESHIGLLQIIKYSDFKEKISCYISEGLQDANRDCTAA